VLELRNLVKHYPAVGDELVRVIDNLSLTISPGELVALYGPSGSGKTTLLFLIAALLEPDSGSIQFAGREVLAMSRDDVADYRLRDIGIVRQDIHLLPGLTALDNAAIKLIGSNTPVPDAHDRVRPLLERLGLGRRLAHREPQLSMGERQRVLIARALSTGPRLILADEPTGSLDTRRGREVLELLCEACREQQTALLMVTHDPQAATFAERVHELRDGSLGDYRPTSLTGR
jgi:putative ABC transport system ATP-binding protein